MPSGSSPPSRNAPLVERFRAARRDPGLALLEGFHPLKHAVRFGAEILLSVTADPDRVGTLTRSLAPDLAGTIEALLETVPSDVFERLVPKPPSSRVVAIARRPVVTMADVLGAMGSAPVVLLENPARLGNLGAAVRAAAAAGAAGLLTVGPPDPWHPEALRGGAGLQFALPIARLDELPPEEALANRVRSWVAIDPEGEDLRADRIPPRALLAFGSERSGLSPALLERASVRLGIPMRPGVSSLNLAAAVAVALYVWRLGSTPPLAPGRPAP